jgi:hypothetical protein
VILLLVAIVANIFFQIPALALAIRRSRGDVLGLHPL